MGDDVVPFNADETENCLQNICDPSRLVWFDLFAGGRQGLCIPSGKYQFSCYTVLSFVLFTSVAFLHKYLAVPTS